MKKLTLCFMLSFLTLSLIYPAKALAEEETKLPSGIGRDQISQKIQDFVKKHEKTSVGMATAVFDTNGTIYQGSFGYMDKEKGIKVDKDSVFEWGAVTKLTVWISVMQLWEEGKIDLEEDIRTYLPEGFLKNLRFEKPITMLDLMNHQAGFDTIPNYLHGDKNIEEILTFYQPIQSFEPGTVTANSNYGTGLASYIVERISGQSFSDYVHEHIFEPLKMNKTAILPDLSDNAFVQAKRKEAKGYDSEGKLLGSANSELGLYSSGRATGTLEDLQKFAQALLKKETLFHRPETWTTLYTATSTYPGTDIVRNAHGFWVSKYNVSVLGQGGHTFGFSSNLLLDLESGVGMIVMTNQSIEERYNLYMPELVFGQRKTASEATKERFSPGYYLSSRIFNSGPLSIAKIIPPFIDRLNSPNEDLLKDEFWTIDDRNGQTTLSLTSSDFKKISDSELFTDYAVTGLGLLASLFALGNILCSIFRDISHLIWHKQKKTLPRSWKVWNYLTSLGIMAVPLQLLLIFQAVLKNDFSGVSSWRYMVFAILGLLLTLAVLLPIFKKSSEKLSRGHVCLTVLTSLSALAMIANILYWSLYQWWVFQ